MRTQRKFDGKINSITNGRWTAYAAAAAATSFAAAHTAEATIHYSGLLNHKIGGRDRVTFQLDPAGGSFVASHFNFLGGSNTTNAGGSARVRFYADQSAAVNGAVCTCLLQTQPRACASKLNLHDAISARPFDGGSALLAIDLYTVPGFWYSCGNFRDRGSGLVGFKFNNGAGDQYGWVRVKMLGGRKNMFWVIDYAYGDPGDRVLAGQTGANASAPELESLGGLALGAARLLAWRRRGSSSFRRA